MYYHCAAEEQCDVLCISLYARAHCARLEFTRITLFSDRTIYPGPCHVMRLSTLVEPTEGVCGISLVVSACMFIVA